MKYNMIRYQFANGTPEDWHREVARFIAALGDLPGPFRIVLEEVALLQRLDRFVVGGRREVEIARVVALFQTAVDDPPLQLRIVVEGCNEAGNFTVPRLGSAVGELISDHEMLHGCLLDGSFGLHRIIWCAYARRRKYGQKCQYGLSFGGSYPDLT